jgi:NH3-dependent NAD+ synthetase
LITTRASSSKSGGGTDLKPITHVYKSQAHQLTAYLGVPQQVRHPLSTEIYPSKQAQEEFCSMLRLEKMDLCLYTEGIPVCQRRFSAAQAAWRRAMFARSAAQLLVKEVAEV